MKKTASYYDILNVSPKASDDEIKRAYHILAKQFHPDRNPQNRRMAELRFRAINEAYASLRTRDKRIAYNRDMRQKRQKLLAQNDNNSGFFSQIGEFLWPAKTINKKEFQK